MAAMQTGAARVVAVLDNVIEDGDVTPAQPAEEGFLPYLLAALDAG